LGKHAWWKKQAHSRLRVRYWFGVVVVVVVVFLVSVAGVIDESAGVVTLCTTTLVAVILSPSWM
jgi:phage-related holin